MTPPETETNPVTPHPIPSNHSRTIQIVTKTINNLNVTGIFRWPTKIKAHRKDKITWKFRNNTTSAVRAGISPFAKLGHQIRLVDPVIFDPATGKSVTIQPGGLEKIKATVRSNAGLGLYAYTFLINEKAAVDPELEIEG